MEFNLKKFKLRILSFKGEFKFLSNFHPCKKIKSAEHLYQASKTVLPKEQKGVMRAETARRARELGQLVTLKKGWDDMKVPIMTKVVRKKFGDDPVLAQQLLDTGDAELIEGNHHKDRFWGVYRGKGENHLGIILMKVREELREEENKKTKTA